MSVELHSLKEGKIVDWDLSVDAAGEIVATHEDEVLKFPGGFDKEQLLAAFDAHNEANKGKKAITDEEQSASQEAVNAAQKLIDSLE